MMIKHMKGKIVDLIKLAKKRTPAQRRKREEVAYRRRLAAYAKFLKDDADWDWEYILKLLKFKLERTRKYIVGTDLDYDSKDVGKQIAEVEALLDRVLNFDYAAEADKEFHKKYGEIVVENEHLDNQGRKCYSVRYSKETPQNSKRIRREARNFRERADLDRKNDLKKAFALMTENIWSWWN